MTSRKEILKNLDIQARFEGETENIKYCRIAVNFAVSSHDWQALTRASWEKYERNVCSGYMFYYLKPWVLEMCKALYPELLETVSDDELCLAAERARLQVEWANEPDENYHIIKVVPPALKKVLRELNKALPSQKE